MVSVKRLSEKCGPAYTTATSICYANKPSKRTFILTIVAFDKALKAEITSHVGLRFLVVRYSWNPDSSSRIEPSLSYKVITGTEFLQNDDGIIL